MTVTIRHAGPGDELDIINLIQELSLDIHTRSTASEHSVRRFFASPDATILLAVDGRVALGMLSYTTRPSLFHAGTAGEIETLVVLTDRRGEGIGKKLLRAGMRLMEDADCVTISVGVEADNQRAQNLYFDAGLASAQVRLERRYGR